MRILLLAFSFVLGSLAHASFKDDSSAIFLPKPLQSLASTTQKFPFFWKGIFLIDATKPTEAVAFAEKFCGLLQIESELIADFYCTDKVFQPNAEQLKDWIRDVSLRETAPSATAFAARAQKQLAFASLPGVPKGILSSLRMDPLSSSQEYWALKEKAVHFSSRYQGYFSNADQSVLMIPFSFKTAPQKAKETGEFFKKIKGLCTQDCPHSTLIGPHAALWVNQSQVLDDLTLVSVLGGIFFVLSLFFLGWKRGQALLSLTLPLVVALVLAVIATVAIFGSIHGLTLAFGPSLVGLVLDYGIHTKIHEGQKEAWSSNLFGLLTTLSGFLALAFSEIPLVRQIMVFAVVGLVTSFVFYYYFSQSKSPLWTKTKFRVFSFQMRPHGWRGPFVLVLLVAPLFLWPWLKLDLNLRNFEFRQPYQAELEKKWWSSSGAPELLFAVHADTELKEIQAEHKWSAETGISQQSWALYVPPVLQQEAALATWTSARCEQLQMKDAVAQNFFKPFAELKVCQNQVATPANPPAYVHDYVSQDKKSAELLSVWFPKDAEAKASLLKEYPRLVSLRSLFEAFPQILLKDVWVMFPLGFLICFLLIYYHVRRLSHSLLALMPMFVAVGMVFVSFALMQKSFSFVSCVAMLMIFGASVDYGIFQVDSLRHAPTPEAEAKTFSSLFMNALSTLLGYLPLVFARHPVLNDLGWVLTLGTVGAFLGGVWGVPYLAERKKWH